MDRDIKKNLTLNLRYRNNSRGFIIDFMSLNMNNQIFPFINIYYFNDASSLHKHYIINIEGNLEIAHDSYKERWVENSASYLEDVSVKFFYARKSIINVYYNNIYKNKKALIKCYRAYSDIEKYLHLIRHALSPYLLNNFIDEPISNLISLLRYADNYDIPVSEFNKDKTLMKK